MHIPQLPNYCVVAGLSATGKSSLVNALANRHGFRAIPEHNDWIGGSHNFPKKPTTVAEKQAKQLFFFDIDIQRHQWAKRNAGPDQSVVADSDFLSPLAHNYAERWVQPDLDVYPWLVDLYCEALLGGDLTPAGHYFYLDASLSTRLVRRESDLHRQRNDIFFDEFFASRMRTFYWSMLNPQSDRRAVQSTWHPYDGSMDNIIREIEGWSRRSVQESQSVDPGELVHNLRATIFDPPDLSM